MNADIKTREYRTVKLYSSLSKAGIYTLSIDGMDEFDTIGLGKYRSNYDFQ